MTPELIAQHIDRLEQRKKYLNLRAMIKWQMRWDNQYEKDEADALEWALEQIKAKP